MEVLSLTMLGQTDAAAAMEAATVRSVWDFIISGGPMMIPIGICSLVALTIIVERSVSLRRKRVIPPEFLTGLQQALDGGADDAQRALDYCHNAGSIIATLFAAGVKRMGAPAAVLEKAVEEAGQRAVLRLRKYLRALSVIAAICPLMGLLGTIFGMITAFQTVAMSAEALGKTELLAEGIYEALITTAAGLLVAIPVLIAYHWICSRIERLVEEMDALMQEFVERHGRRHGEAWSPAEVGGVRRVSSGHDGPAPALQPASSGSTP